MSLIDRYVSEVGRPLPGKERADIEAEIRSTLEDTIEENAEKSGKPADNADISAVLKQFGDPELLAQKYSPAKRYLIGRRWYGFYTQILKRVLGIALPISLLVLFFVKSAETSESIIRVLIQAVGEAFNIGIHMWFWITIIFVILEHADVKPNELDGQEPREWTPDQLPQLPKQRQISVSDVLTDLISVIGGIALVALSTQVMRIQIDGESIPLLHPNLWKVWIPLFFVITGFTLIHELFKLKIGNWTPALTITNVILGLASIVYILALVMTQEVINPAFLTIFGNGKVTPEFRETVIWTIGITVAIIIGIYVWNIYNSIVMAKRLIKKEKS